ncbi:hypothetical protein TIFTF001_006265 [Ficus carica]|uniref:Uncharacterized protein n=1 Tax=Ficus carica TaxID=3494 RepID=A0AA88D0J4_FICCA|nr:hypothetical protein TIFTF001_006265 [Ficus carica]
MDVVVQQCNKSSRAKACPAKGKKGHGGFSRRCAALVKEQRARIYILRRCATMLLCWTLPFSFYLIGDKPVGFLGDSEKVYRTQFSCFFTNRARRSMDSTTTTNGRGAEMEGYLCIWL